MTTMIAQPEFLQLRDNNNALFFGCDQDWFRSFWQRKAGCGSCTGANILHYFMRRGQLRLPIDINSQDDFVRLMEHSWRYLTPGVMGLHIPARMKEGLDRMLEELGCPRRSLLLEIPDRLEERPAVGTVEAFIREGLASDSPLAFLNLHNGDIPQLEGWHWVTVVGLTGSGDSAVMEIYDNGNHLKVSLAQWLGSARRGGGFVYVGQAELCKAD